MSINPDSKLMTAEDWKSLADSSNKIIDESRGYVIEMTGSAQPQYLSEQIGRNFGSPYGGWTADINEATVYETAAEAEALFDKALVGVAPFCKVVAK